jgi:PAS domain S-box-containing protein
MSREVERRRRAEEVLQGLNNALEQRVAARTTELRREVSERRRTEEILQSTSNFLDTVVESFPGMVFVKDARDRRFVLFNRAGEELLGCHRSSLIGKRDHDIFPKEEADSFVARDQRVLESGKTVVIPEERITTRERGVRLLRTTCVAVPGDQGRAREGIELDVSTPGRLGGSVQRHAGDSVKALLEFADSVSRGRSPSGLIVGSPA